MLLTQEASTLGGNGTQTMMVPPRVGTETTGGDRTTTPTTTIITIITEAAVGFSMMQTVDRWFSVGHATYGATLHETVQQ